MQNPGEVPTGKFLITSLHVICGLDLPNQKFWIRLQIGDCLKNFFEDLFFFFGEHLQLCPWPREGLSSERLSLVSDFFVSLALASSLVFSNPPLGMRSDFRARRAREAVACLRRSSASRMRQS